MPSRPRFASEAAALVYDSAVALWSFVFRGDAAAARRVFTRLARRRRGAFGWGFATLALQGGRVAALELGFDRRQQREHEPYTKLFFALAVPPRLWPHLARTVAPVVESVTPPLGEDAYHVSHLAVVPELRGRGIGERVLRRTFERAAAEGYRRCELDVATSNLAARRFYERLGMVVTTEKRSPENESRYGIPGAWRMEIEL